jgi:hypothetical protein
MLSMQGTYRLCKATAAIERRDGQTHCYQVPEGALIAVNGFNREGPMVEVLYADHQVFMFEDDLIQRAQPITGPRTNRTA